MKFNEKELEEIKDAMSVVIENLIHRNLMVVNEGTQHHPDYIVGGTDDLKRELCHYVESLLAG